MVTRLRQQGFTLFVAAALAGVPVMGTVCMGLCAPASAAAARASSSEGDHTVHCEDASPTAAVSLGVSSLHSCGRHDVPHVGGTLAVAPGRADTGAMIVAIALGNVTVGLFGSPVALLQSSDHSPPISPPSPTRAPLVLRI